MRRYFILTTKKCRIYAAFGVSQTPIKSLEGKDKLKVFAEELSYTKARPAVINEKAIDELIINAILEVDYGQSSAEDALTSLAQKLNENIASNYQ